MFKVFKIFEVSNFINASISNDIRKILSFENNSVSLGPSLTLSFHKLSKLSQSLNKKNIPTFWRNENLDDFPRFLRRVN